MTLSKKHSQKVFQLLQKAIDTLIVLINIVSVENYLTLEDKTQIFMFCNKIYKFISLDALKLLYQLVKSMDSMNYRMLKQELDCISKKKKNDVFNNANQYISFLESKVMDFTCPRKFELDKSLEKPLKQVVNKSIKVSLKKRFHHI